MRLSVLVHFLPTGSSQPASDREDTGSFFSQSLDTCTVVSCKFGGHEFLVDARGEWGTNSRRYCLRLTRRRGPPHTPGRDIWSAPANAHKSKYS